MGCLISSLISTLSRGLFPRMYHPLDVKGCTSSGQLELAPLLGLAAFFPHIQDVPAREAFGTIT